MWRTALNLHSIGGIQAVDGVSRCCKMCCSVEDHLKPAGRREDLQIFTCRANTDVAFSVKIFGTSLCGRGT